MPNSIINNIATETTGIITESGFAALASAAGFPALAFASPLAKGLILGIIENCYNDCAQRTLSIRESKKLDQVSKVALHTFRELAETDGVVAWEMDRDPSYFDYAYEVAEHITLEAIRQSELKKVDILGRFYGSHIYKGNRDWQDMHQMITMAGTLTLRQLIMIRLIADDFEGLDTYLFIGNPSACVEINRLKDYGIWQTEGAAFGINESCSLQLDSIIPTIYSEQVCESLMLERLSNDDIERTIDSLHLTSEGSKEKVLTEDDYNRHTNWQEFDSNGQIAIDPSVLKREEEPYERDF